MTVLIFSLLTGVIAWLSAMIAPAVVSWASYLGTIAVGSSRLGVLRYRYAPWGVMGAILIVMAAR